MRVAVALCVVLAFLVGTLAADDFGLTIPTDDPEKGDCCGPYISSIAFFFKKENSQSKKKILQIIVGLDCVGFAIRSGVPLSDCNQGAKSCIPGAGKWKKTPHFVRHAWVVFQPCFHGVSSTG